MTPIICKTEAKTKIAKKAVKKEPPTRLLNETKSIFPDASLHGKTELDAAGFIRAEENDKRAPA